MKLNEKRVSELEVVIKKMEAVSGGFYLDAQKVGNHSFIEFTGLMNEYINICRDALEHGIDFGLANSHTGVGLPLFSYRVKYLAEKLDCIYGEGLRKDPILKEELFGRYHR